MAPTILSLLDIELPDSMEGRSFERSGTGGSAEDRREWIERANAEAVWRDDIVALIATASWSPSSSSGCSPCGP